MRIGFGYDAHRLVAGRPLIVGGVQIPFEYGLQGHSDADVLLHAICDALLGAAGLGDLGLHFPDHEKAWEGVSSIVLLRKVADMLKKYNYHVVNLDTTIVAQAPRLAPYVDQMVAAICKAINVTAAQVNVKATTTEGMGFTGSGEGIAAYAVASIVSTAEGATEDEMDG
ncbi:MAG: 2-C-methyl-D-erythritol 2,4-cyclodiphosphate synthase [Deltaproteobacteria bacterium]|nr:2-C-methyl-D-erythritol 2,4-cyclodiphosphate synthase [Deltaproteobacteria bacterium]MBW2071118.1 2-C-methyl-D-erythritol 2,4-cyclodiphosphate synthase [Deltaproteobacteria bacterium]